MNEHDLLRCIQARVARMAVGVSAARGQGAGVVAAGREFFETLPLPPFGQAKRSAFQADLDQVTDELRRALPPAAQSWGLARKLVNIFLRDSAYTSHLRDAFRLHLVEPLLELPLDSITARALQEDGGDRLPSWLGVKALTPAASDQYQRAAQERARQMGIARVHLDAYWWADQRSRRAVQRERG